MNILLATDTYYPNVNGAAYFTYRLANALAERGHAVSVLCPSTGLKDTVTKDKGVTVYGIRSINLPVYEKFRISPLILSGKTIQKIVQEIAPDVVHIQNHFMIGKGVARAAKKLGIPTIGTSHFMPENLIHYFHMPIPAEKQLEKIGWKQCVDVFEQLDAVTTPTKTAAALLKKAGFSKEIGVLSCGIDLERFKPTNDGSYLKQRYGISTETPVVLYVGRLDAEKKIDVILRAFAEMRTKINAQLVIAGNGKQRASLEDLARELGIETSVTFTGFIPDEDLQNIYRVADVFVIAGIAELQSIVTMEAMASGLPIVAVNATALPELVHDGENGYLFDEGDTHMLATLLGDILGDEKLKHRMQQKSLEMIQMHDIKKTISAFETIYDRVRQAHTNTHPLRTTKTSLAVES